MGRGSSRSSFRSISSLSSASSTSNSRSNSTDLTERLQQQQHQHQQELGRTLEQKREQQREQQRERQWEKDEDEEEGEGEEEEEYDSDDDIEPRRRGELAGSVKGASSFRRPNMSAESGSDSDDDIPKIPRIPRISKASRGDTKGAAARGGEEEREGGAAELPPLSLLPFLRASRLSAEAADRGERLAALSRWPMMGDIQIRGLSMRYSAGRPLALRGRVGGLLLSRLHRRAKDHLYIWALSGFYHKPMRRSSKTLNFTRRFLVTLFT